MSKQSSFNSSSSLSSISSLKNSLTTTSTKSLTSTLPFHPNNNSTLKFGFNRIRCHYPNIYNYLSAIEKSRENFWPVDIRKNAKIKVKNPHYLFNNGIATEQIKQVSGVAEQIWFRTSIVKLVGSFLIALLFLTLVAFAVFIRVETKSTSAANRISNIALMKILSANQSTKANNGRANPSLNASELSPVSINTTPAKQQNDAAIKKNSTFSQLMETFFPENLLRVNESETFKIYDGK